MSIHHVGQEVTPVCGKAVMAAPDINKVVACPSFWMYTYKPSGSSSEPTAEQLLLSDIESEFCLYTRTKLSKGDVHRLEPGSAGIAQT